MNLLKKFINFSVGNILVLLIGFISYPMITRMISPEEMGKFTTFGTVINLIIVIVTLGLDQAFVRYFYEEILDSRKKLLKICLGIPLGISVLTSIFLFIFRQQITYYISVSSANSILCISLVIIFVIISLISKFQLLNIRMEQKAKYYSFYNILVKILYLLLVVVLFQFFNDDYMTLVLATVGSTLIAVIMEAIVNRKFYISNTKNVQLNTSYKAVFRYSLPLVLSTAMTWLFQSIDKLMLKGLEGPEELGIYTGALAIVTMINVAQNAFTTFWVPVAYEHYKNHPDDKLFFIRVNKIVSFVMLIIAVGLIASKDILKLLLGVQYTQSANVFPFLVFMPIMYTISETTVMGINFKERSEFHLIIASISAAVNVLGNYLLIPHMGAQGAAISTGISYIVFFVTRTFFSMRMYKIKFAFIRFMISTILVYGLAIAAIVFQLNFGITVVLALCVIAGICILYRDIIKMGIEFVNENRAKLLK
jgi:O-antigen/teichoic acid export membrane protein